LCGFSPGWTWNRWSFASNILHAFNGVMVSYWILYLYLLLPFFPVEFSSDTQKYDCSVHSGTWKTVRHKALNIQSLLRPWKKIRYSTTKGISQITFIRVADKDIKWAHCYECRYYCNVWCLVKPTTSCDKCHLTQEIQRCVFCYCKLLLIVFVC